MDVSKPSSKGAKGSTVTKMQRSQKERQDESIMNTNNSCIVSKRSVEKVYHGEDQGFLRHFVNKYQRRSPLINRGYWLRMRAVETAVYSFLSTNGNRDTFVVNLGCGYDTLPFKFLETQPEICAFTTFVDVDYRQLIEKKCAVIRTTEILSRLCGDLDNHPKSPNVLLQSDRYCAVSADLQSKTDLEALPGILNAGCLPILFLAEVSMTYMETDACSNVIEWASTFPNATFVLLEQYLPDGPSHAFASTMLQHFVKLHSPLKSAVRYPSLEAQEQRFTERGWSSANAQSLWSLWNSDEFLDDKVRHAVDCVEPFDEWEEFALYAAHYFLLTATTRQPPVNNTGTSISTSPANRHEPKVLQGDFEHYASKKYGRRRLGAGFMSKTGKVHHHGGYGPRGRLEKSDVLEQNRPEGERQATNASQRQSFKHETCCHTITRLKSGSHLLVGGRLSPDKAIASCYLENDGTWRKVESLPAGRYRHSAVAWGDGVMVMGGKLDTATMAIDWIYWEYGKGWSNVSFIGEAPPASFGACATELTAAFTQSQTEQCSALLIGGIGTNGKIIEDAWQIDLIFNVPNVGPMVRCWQPSFKYDGLQASPFRFGALITIIAEHIFVAGGVASAGYVSEVEEVLCINKDYRATACRLAYSSEMRPPRVMLTGHQITSVSSDTFLIYGGGANCFSFGSCWNDTVITVNAKESVPPDPAWTLALPSNRERVGKAVPAGVDHHQINAKKQKPAIPIRRVQLQSQSDFDAIVAQREPVIIEQLPIGECVEKWTNTYLISAFGAKTEVTVHSSSDANMNFLEKNFDYIKKPFGVFMNDIAHGEKEYMRAISTADPTVKATNLHDDFPSIAADFQLPAMLSYVTKHAHSSPLRISGPVAMWLHYDVMSNVLCQIRGAKRLLLYSPREVSKLGFPPGASSSRLNAWDEEGSLDTILRSAQALEANLKPGEVLYIPSLWAHTALPKDGMSVAVNVFFRDLQEGYAAGKDVYGNRDLQAYENGRRDVERIIRSFKKLPPECAHFYLQRLADELGEAAQRA